MTVVLKYTPFLENWEVKAKERKKISKQKRPILTYGPRCLLAPQTAIPKRAFVGWNEDKVRTNR